jgi:hypothetical protein
MCQQDSVTGVPTADQVAFHGERAGISTYENQKLGQYREVAASAGLLNIELPIAKFERGWLRCRAQWQPQNPNAEVQR